MGEAQHSDDCSRSRLPDTGGAGVQIEVTLAVETAKRKDGGLSLFPTVLTPPDYFTEACTVSLRSNNTNLPVHR